MDFRRCLGLELSSAADIYGSSDSFAGRTSLKVVVALMACPLPSLEETLFEEQLLPSILQECYSVGPRTDRDAVVLMKLLMLKVKRMLDELLGCTTQGHLPLEDLVIQLCKNNTVPRNIYLDERVAFGRFVFMSS